MLYKASFLTQCDILATDGSIGSVHDQYFDDRSWSLRYLVVDTGNWLPGRKVLIAPTAISAVDAKNDALRLDLSKQQVTESPGMSSDLPVSRQMEEQMSRHFGWPAYWDAEAAAGIIAPPMIPPFAPQEPPSPPQKDTAPPIANPNLRSVAEIRGHGISVTDGELGTVDDVIFNDGGWMIRYLVIETGTWLSGRKVLLAPSWCDSIDWSERVIRARLSRDAIESCPEFDPDVPITRDYEDAIHQHYREDTYWIDA